MIPRVRRYPLRPYTRLQRRMREERTHYIDDDGERQTMTILYFDFINRGVTAYESALTSAARPLPISQGEPDAHLSD